jgi:actin-related protein 5
LNLTPIFSKYRDRKAGKTYSFVGQDVYADTTAKGHMRNAFEAGSGIVSNWDVMESILDYVFIKLGVDGDNGVDVPMVMTEAVANLAYSRKCRFIGLFMKVLLTCNISYDGNHLRMLFCTIASIWH